MIIDSSTIRGTLPEPEGTWYYPGLYNMGTSMTVTNSTISGNTEVGILTGTSMSLVFSTVAENGSIGILTQLGSVFTLENSIVENNGDRNCVIGSPEGKLEASGVNLSDNSCASYSDDGTTIVISSDASLGHLANNSGPGQTNALLPGQPCDRRSYGVLPGHRRARNSATKRLGLRYWSI